MEYLKNKNLCAKKIEKVPRDKLAENAMKIKSYQNSFVLVSAIMIRINKSAKLVLHLIMKILRIRKIHHTNQKLLLKKKVLKILKNVSNPVFKRTTIDFDEKLLVIKQ